MLTIEQIKKVGIPNNISRLNNSAQLPSAIPNNSVNLYEALEVMLTHLGILPLPASLKPINMTETVRDQLTDVDTGSIIYNISTNKLNMYTGSSWEEITST